MTLRHWQVFAFLAALIVGAVVLASRTGCRKGPSNIERQVDSVLASAPAWADTVRARDSVLAAREREARRLRRELAQMKDSAAAKLRRADSLMAQADTLADLPAGISPHDSIVALQLALSAQKQATARLRVEVIPAMQEAMVKAEAALVQADATIRIQQHDLGEAYDRIDALTVNLSNLREETKHKGDWNLPLGIHLPGWTKCVVTGVGGAAVGALVDEVRGAALGGGTGLAGCLVG
jgi:hypothetical protein